MTRPDLHIVRFDARPPVDFDRLPNLLDQLQRNERKLRQRPSWFATLIADWREFFSDIADAPAHHAGFAILVVVAWSVLLIAPLWLGMVS